MLRPLLIASLTASAVFSSCATLPKPHESAPMFDHVSTTPYIGDLSVERYVHKGNQLSVLLVQDPSSETIAYHTYFNVGSSDEVPGKTGLAHLFEHMMFKRTDKYDDQHFSKTIEAAGGPDLNAWTWLDITAYHVSLPSRELPMIVDLEATRMDGLLIDKDQLESEREVVLNERKYRVDNSPEGQMNEQLWALAFEKNRYHWPTIGWEDDIKGYTVDDCMDFYRSYYAPNNATVVLVGGFDKDEALRVLDAGYGKIPASDLQRLEHGDEPEQTALRRKDMDLEMQSEVLQWGFKVPAIDHADRPALAVLDAILTVGASGRLQRRFIDSGWAASATGWLPPFQHDALYEFSVTMREGRSVEAAVQILENELEDLRSNLVSEEEMDRARAQLLADQYEQLLSNSGRAGFLGFYEVAWGDWRSGIDFLDALREVTREDVRRVAATWFRQDHSSMLVGHPKGKDVETFTKADLPTIPAKGDEALPEVSARPLGSASTLTIGAVERSEMDDWTRLVVHDPALPMVWFQLGLSAGSGVEPADKAGLANVTAEMLLRGTQKLGRETFEEILEGYGASLGAGVGADSISMSGSTLSENWPKVASLVAQALAEPAFAEEEFKALVDELKADIIEERNSDRSIGRRFYNAALWGEHPYGRPVIGTLDSLDRISLADVKAFYAEWFSTQDAVVGLLGNFDDGAMADLQTLVDSLPRERSALPASPAVVSPVGRRIVLVDKPERSQVQLFMGHPFIRPEGADYAAAWTANEAFAGHGFGARMMQEVREKRGWSYGAYGSIQHRKDASSYTLWVFPAVADAIPCLQLVLDLYEGFAKDGISSDEFDYARSSIVGSAAFYRDTPSKRLSYEVRKQSTGYDPAALVGVVDGLSHEAVQQAASEAFDPGNLVAVLVGTADGLVTLGEGDDAREVTLADALREIFGNDGVEVVPFDQ